MLFDYIVLLWDGELPFHNMHKSWGSIPDFSSFKHNNFKY